MQTQTDTITRLQRQQAALAAFGSYAFREPVLLNILDQAAQVCAEGLGVPFCKICEYRSRENDLLVVAGYGWQAGVIGRVMSRADSTSPQGRAFSSGAPVIIADLNVAQNYVFPAFYAQHGIVSTLDVIIKSHAGAPYGVLEIDSPVQQTFDEHDVVFLTGFANVLAEAVDTARRLARLEEVLAEKQVFAEELKHRVRNNLQLVNGMLTAHLNTDPAGQAGRLSIGAIIRRIMALAEVYEQLLGTGLGRTIDFGGYLSSLCQALPSLQTQVQTGQGIVLDCETEPLLVSLDTVTALGMAVAELVSNSFEHAVTATAPLTIRISLQRANVAQQAILLIHDNGPGFREAPMSKRHGVGLVRRLVQQVKGETTLDTANGTAWTIRFPISEPPSQPIGHPVATV